jgi:exopolyphosphatase/guanosine-5'-triphosphate,3'-diphosphate pyrophosphatase
VNEIITSNIKPYVKNIDQFHAVAGTATTIATTAEGLKDNEVDKIDGYELYYDKLIKIYNNYLKANSKEISKKYGVHPKRADLITAGTLILKQSFELLEINKLKISSKGLRFGFLIEKAKEIFHT